MSATSKPYGWHAVPRNPATALPGKTKLANPTPFFTTDIKYPDTELVRQSLARVEKELAPETLNRSLRVYYFGMAIIQIKFPAWLSDGWLDEETCMHMSFGFWGGTEAMQMLQSFGADKSQPKSVAECITSHQDPGETGTISCDLVYPETIKNVMEKYPRKGWSRCFAKTIREEIGLKPWARSTAVNGFAETVENNELMKEYD